MLISAVKTVRGYSSTQEDAKIPVGAEVMIKYSKKRIPGNHRRYFAMLNLMFESQNHWEDMNVFRAWIQMKAGYFTSASAPNGVIVFVADSIRFDKMDEPEFKELFSKVINVWLVEFGENSPEHIVDQIIRF